VTGAFHCHNDIHAASGMFAQVIERAGELQAMLGKWTRSSTEDKPWDYTFTPATGVSTVLSNAVKVLMDQALEWYGYKTTASAGARAAAVPKKGRALAFKA
jgi:hypothetical protein